MSWADDNCYDPPDEIYCDRCSKELKSDYYIQLNDRDGGTIVCCLKCFSKLIKRESEI